MKGINRIIDALVSNGRSNKVNIDSDSLLECLAKSDYKPASNRWWEFRYQKGFRLILVLSTLIMMITVIILYSIRYLNDVLLYENQLTINEQGAFNPQKSQNCEYALFLFNTADLWANSGILVNEKDRIRINISGGYNAQVKHAIDAADNNRYPIFPWISYDFDSIEQNPKVPIYCCISREDKHEDHRIKHCISRENKHGVYRFGSAIYAIAPESRNFKEQPLGLSKEKRNNYLQYWFYKLTNSKNWNGSMYLWESNNKSRLFSWVFPDSRDFHRAGRTGALFFAVNDVYIQDLDTLKKYYDALGESYTKEQIKNLSERPKHTYENNLGQLLVSVEIQRHVPYYLIYPTMAYRFFEYHVNETLDSIYFNYDNCGFLRLMHWFTKLVICSFWFVVFCGWVTLLFGFYMIILLIIIFILFITGRWFFSVFDKAYLKIISITTKNDA